MCNQGLTSYGVERWPHIMLVSHHTLMAQIMINGKNVFPSQRNRKKDMGFLEEFLMLDMKDPTPREKELLQHNDQTLSVIYEASDTWSLSP